MCWKDGVGNKVIGTTRERRSQHMPDPIGEPNIDPPEDNDEGEVTLKKTTKRSAKQHRNTTSLAFQSPRGIGMGQRTAAEQFRKTYKHGK